MLRVSSRKLFAAVEAMDQVGMIAFVKSDRLIKARRRSARAHRWGRAFLGKFLSRVRGDIRRVPRLRRNVSRVEARPLSSRLWRSGATADMGNGPFVVGKRRKEEGPRSTVSTPAREPGSRPFVSVVGVVASDSAKGPISRDRESGRRGLPRGREDSGRSRALFPRGPPARRDESGLRRLGGA